MAMRYQPTEGEWLLLLAALDVASVYVDGGEIRDLRKRIAPNATEEPPAKDVADRIRGELLPIVERHLREGHLCEASSVLGALLAVTIATSILTGAGVELRDELLARVQDQVTKLIVERRG